MAIHSGSAEPAKLAAAVVEAMKKEYGWLEAEETHETVAGHDLLGYDLAFYCLDLTNTAQVRSLRTAQTTYTIFCQAEDREFEQLQMVFQAMTMSLLSTISPVCVDDLYLSSLRGLAIIRPCCVPARCA